MGTELFGGRMTTRLFIPETRKLMIRKDKYTSYIIVLLRMMFKPVEAIQQVFVF